MKNLLYLLLMIAILSCKKEEKPVPKHQAGNGFTNSFEMGTDYRYQAYFDIKSNTFVKYNLKTDWDLGFESGINGWHVILNSANAMSIARVSGIFANIIDTVGVTWNWDASSGNLDSTAIGDWQNDNYIYILDKGQDLLGNHRGFCKLEFNSVSTTDYAFRIANLDGSNDQVSTVTKNQNVNFTAFSCSERMVKDIEPNKEDWDIQFTQFIHYFYVEDLAYLVTGVLLNRNKVEVAQIFDKEYLEITYDDISTLDFQNSIDAIGYNWKAYDFGAGTYVVDPNKSYIIKTTEGIYYKLHFIDFYNENGDKGTPVFETQML